MRLTWGTPRYHRSTAPPAHLRQATVLVCDDEPVVRALVRASLDDGAYEIVEAADGAQSLELARQLRPDLVVLDLMMPERTGLGVLRELRNEAELAATPVIVLTARTQTVDREVAARLGADRFLTKPFSPLELAELVAELLEARQ